MARVVTVFKGLIVMDQYTACSIKNRHFALECTIFVRFKISLTFWGHYSIMKNWAKNNSSKIMSNKSAAISVRHVGTGNS